MLAALLIAGGIAFFVTIVADDRLDTIGPSMRPTLENRIKLEIDEDAYADSAPMLGDVVAAQAPSGIDTASCGGLRRAGSPCARPAAEYSSVRVIKRVVAGPDDTVGFARDGRLVRNGERVAEPHIRPCSVPCPLPRPIVVLPEHYFLAGDNRPASTDSRDWGPVPLEAIDGEVIVPQSGG